MKELKLLIVEDDSIIIDTYRRNIESYNKTGNNIKIEETILSNKDRALETLRNSDNIFDGAIIDLDLKQSGGSDSSGNEIIKEVKRNLRFPIFVISGTSHNLDTSLKEETSFFKVRDRDADFDFIQEFIDIYNTGITKILKRKGTIETYINKIFWNHISTSLDNWILDTKRNSKEKENSLLRFTIFHMLEYLDESNVHPSEFYIARPVKQVLSTGDLICWNNKRYIVLTPACDFVIRTNGKRNVRFAFLLKVIELNDYFPNYQQSLKEGKFSETLKKKLRKIIGNKKSYYHFIPKHNLISAGIIDFQEKLSVSIEEIEERIAENEIDRIATISSPFLKDLIERYSSYYSRQGSPDFEADELIDSLLEE